MIEWLKEWAKYFLTTENTHLPDLLGKSRAVPGESTEILKGFLRVLCVLRGESILRQVHTIIHFSK